MDPKIEDRKLLHAFVLSKDELAFSELVHRHQVMMRAAAFRVCGNAEDAKDAIQRALIAFARRAGEIRADPSVGPWLHRATTLEALAVRRQRINTSIREREAMEQRQLQTGSMPQEITVELDDAINRLSPKDRSVIILHYLEKLTFSAIARKHGGTEAAWQKRGVRALEKLSNMLRRRGVVATGTLVGTILATGSAEAAVPYIEIKTMLNEVLRHQLATSAQTSSTMLVIMKLNYSFLLFFVGGAIVSYGWNERDSSSKISEDSTINNVSLSTSRINESSIHDSVFSLQRVVAAIRHYDSRNDVNLNDESHLRALMFSVPESYLDSVCRTLVDVDNPDRFSEIVACFYSHWAEIDLESARNAALSEEAYIQPAHRGVMLTWLNANPDTAMEAMLKYRTEEDLSILDEFVEWKCQHDPMEAAMLVDLLPESWPKANRVLFEKVAKIWANTDPYVAGDWMESYWDTDFSNALLKRYSWRVARTNVNDGLGLANRIDDPELRRFARYEAILWAGIGSGINALRLNEDGVSMEIPKSYPGDWDAKEVYAFCYGTMQNSWEQSPELIELAKTEEQRQEVYEGIICGSTHSQPTAAITAVENVSTEYASSELGRNALSSFIIRWAESDVQAAYSWLDQQPNDLKTTVMREAIKTRTDW